LILLCVLFVVLLAGIATAPPSKHDDLHYHLLIPHRGLIEGHWSWYATPYLQAAPHVAYQSLLAPLLAIGLPASAGIFSLLWGLVLVLLVVERARRISSARAVLAAGILLVGLANAVWWVAPNPTSVSALWSSLLFLWLFDRDELCAPGRLSPAEYGIGAALLAGALFLTKVSFLLPAGLALLVVLVGVRPTSIVRSVGVMMVVVALTVGPWLYCCGRGTGNPLGFASAGLFGDGVFDRERLQAELVFSRMKNQYGEPGVFSPLWGVVGWGGEVLRLRDVNLLQPVLALGLGIPVLVCCRRWGLLAAVLVSSLCLAWAVPHDSRFHLFSLNGLFLAAILGTPSGWITPLRLRLAPILTLLVCLPSVAVTGWYSTLFWPAAVGLQSREDFLRTRTGLYEVWQWCARETPADARFCIALGRLPRLFYLPRLALSPEGLTKAENADKSDLVSYMKRTRLRYLVSEHDQRDVPGLVLVREFRGVIVEAFRTPARAATPRRGTVWLYQLSWESATGRPSGEAEVQQP
jgi:hypothetical protein